MMKVTWTNHHFIYPDFFFFFLYSLLSKISVSQSSLFSLDNSENKVKKTSKKHALYRFRLNSKNSNRKS